MGSVEGGGGGAGGAGIVGPSVAPTAAPHSKQNRLAAGMSRRHDAHCIVGRIVSGPPDDRRTSSQLRVKVPAQARRAPIHGDSAQSSGSQHIAPAVPHDRPHDHRHEAEIRRPHVCHRRRMIRILRFEAPRITSCIVGILGCPEARFRSRGDRPGCAASPSALRETGRLNRAWSDRRCRYY